MHILQNLDRQRAAGLFDRFYPSRVYLDGFFQGTIPGVVYVDQMESPTMAFVVLEFHHVTYVGFSSPPQSFEMEFEYLLKEEVYLLLIWPENFSAIPPTNHFSRKFKRFEFTSQRPPQEDQPPAISTSAPWSIVDLNPDNFETCESKGECLLAYETRGRFFKECFGLVANSQGEYRGNAEVICQSRDREGHLVGDIQIVVTESARRTGLGFQLSQALIAQMASRGIRPIWTCHADNEASLGLARKLGFSDPVEFEILSYQTQPGLQGYWYEILESLGTNPSNISATVAELQSRYQFHRLEAHRLVVTYLSKLEET